jgi:hypothetical protein
MLHVYWFFLFFKVAAGILEKGERDDTFNKTEVISVEDDKPDEIDLSEIKNEAFIEKKTYFSMFNSYVDNKLSPQ